MAPSSESILKLNLLDRKRAQNEAYPSVVYIDSQSIKLNPMICEYRGTVANKWVNGRKRQFVVDTQGGLWLAAVHPANQADGPAAVSLIGDILWLVGEHLEKVYVDQSYNGVFSKTIAEWSIGFEKASRPESAQGFVPVAKQWVVERSIAWTNFFGSSRIISIPYHLRSIGFIWPTFRLCYNEFNSFSQFNSPTHS